MNRILIAFLLTLSAALHAADRKSPVKVFILAGQSNMEGQAVADLDGKDYNQGKGTLNYLMKDPAKAPLFKHLKNAQGQWTVRDDVWVWYKPENGPVKSGPLGLGFTVYDGKHHFGPELQFGHVMGDHLANQVLLIKTAWGGKSLYNDFRPPSSGGEVGPYYRKMIEQVREAVAHLKDSFPEYDGGGYELAGFVWYHGWNDGCDPRNAVPEYEKNLVNLIRDVRKDLEAPNLPVVIGELTGPWVQAPGEWATLRNAQAAAATRPEFKGSVLFVETHDFVRKPEDSPCPGHGHHEFANAETYFLVGNALGEGMKKLCPAPAAKCGERGQPREWIFIQLARMWYVRETGWKLNQAGELLDMSQSPFEEHLVAADTTNPAAIGARKRLQAVLDQLNPDGGILDDGDGTGRHANRNKKNDRAETVTPSTRPESRPVTAGWR